MVSLTTQDLLGLLKDINGNKEEKDIAQYRYAIYTRKSTEGEERQAKSLGDQIIECNKLVESKKLTTLKSPHSPIQEKQSAKEPDIRPKFRQMLDDVKKGKFDGIVAWHPDRLARNMKEAGEIIDLLDKKIIKDLQFASFTFENDTAGKMLLGISFVLSKQYSDKLSDDVKRGIRNRSLEGKYLSKAKHGYYKDRNKNLRPDGNNFNIIQTAWQMRLEGITQVEIAKYVNNEKYERSEGVGDTKHIPFHMTDKVLSEIFQDTFYTGVLSYGQKNPTITDLTEVIADFVPMVSVDEFMKLNKLKSISKTFQTKHRGLKNNVKADFLRKTIFCGHCGNPMSAGVTTKKGKDGKVNYFFFRCDTKDCKIKIKDRTVKQNVRAKVVLDFVYQFLDQNSFGTKKAYNHYLEEMKVVCEKERRDLDSRRKSVQQLATALEERISQIRDLMVDLDKNDKAVLDSFKVDLKTKSGTLKDYIKEIATIKEAQTQASKAIIAYSDFIELFNNLSTILRETKTMEGKDQIIRKIFSNFTLEDKKVASYQLNPPFDVFVKKSNISYCRGGEN